MGTCKSATGGLRLMNPHRSLALHFHFVHVTPAPVLARLEGLDDGMPGRVEVFGRVRVLRAVAAADVPAGQAQAQMYPGVAHFQAFLAASATRRYIMNRPEMGTGRCLLILLDVRYPVAPIWPLPFIIPRRRPRRPDARVPSVSPRWPLRPNSVGWPAARETHH